MAKDTELNHPCMGTCSGYTQGHVNGRKEGVKYILSTDAIVSIHEALLGQHPIPDALAKWDNLMESIDKKGN